MNIYWYDRKVIIHDSENVEEISYQYQNQTMIVRFQTTATYIYRKVTPKIFGEIIASESVGIALRELVTSFPKIYPFERID